MRNVEVAPQTGCTTEMQPRKAALSVRDSPNKLDAKRNVERAKRATQRIMIVVLLGIIVALWLDNTLVWR